MRAKARAPEAWRPRWPGLADGKAPEAQRFLELNLRNFPRSVNTYFALARAHEAQGDRPGAIAAMEKAAALQLDNRRIQAALQRLTGEGG